MTSQRRTAPARRTAPPATAPAEPDNASGVKFRISGVVLRQLLRLASDVTITGATFDPATGLVEFNLDIPSAPPGAEELMVSYRHTGTRDPIHAQSEWATKGAS